MFVINRTQTIIQLYVGEIPEEDMQTDEIIVEDNIEVDGEQNLNPNAEQPQNDEAESDTSDASHEGDGDSCREFEYDSDFNFFLNGDGLNDACDPIDEVKRDVGEVDCHLKQPDYAKYMELISEEYNTYINSKVKGKMVDNEDVSDDEMLKQIYDSNDEAMEHEFPEFNRERDLKNPELTVGRIFTNIYDFRVADRMYSILNGFEVTLPKNDKDKAVAICTNNCRWRIYPSGYNRSKVTLQVKSIKGLPDECPWSYKNKSANSRWLSKMFMEEIADHLCMKVKGYKKSIKKKYNLNCTNSQMYRAKENAEEVVKGSCAKQYARLRNYCAILLQKNPGSMAFIIIEKSQLCKSPIFKRMFVMFTAQKEGFVNACRAVNVIGLDACHLKGIIGGQLISAIGRDAIT
ncbi:uncharacterized protein [Coffea arabica]|uniref:Uncharacterized protein isoform X1 n=1 Tax=Coffea arabica TaxID=13443 RepID=A0ABM4UWG9_COFAR